MKKMISVAALLAVSLTSFSASAADTMLKLPIAAAMAANDAQSRLGDSVKFYFADQPTPKVLTKITSDKTSQRTNGFGKSAEKACNWVFLSAMLALQKRAQEVGANAVINIVSNFKDVEMASQTEFECADGAIMAGVALKADFVKIAQ
ncbi:excinuclease ATPase subunit [Duganella aceris]|uniref:Excinuclease ATPase subunit n=1 Tax=Duganella aceris TaxID=2703883 RepID=A0ABX0FHR8_9BURK|nr:excinuclease ATPase subunit [Duganella aceris]NGZ84059.1 excinuclease ATPase subunit [Duganella aceris]